MSVRTKKQIGFVWSMSTTLLAALSPVAVAGTGVFESYVVVNGQFYDMQATTGNPDFIGTNFGTFLATGTLTASGGELKTFKNGGGNVTGAELNWRAYASGSPAYTSINLPFSANLGGGGDQSWQATGQTGNVLSNAFSAGAYTYEVYGRAFTNEGDRFSSNGGANYKASFAIRATDFTWSTTPANGTLGAAGDGGASSNWVGGVRPGQGHNLYFGSSSTTSLTNGFTAVNSITFNSGAAAYTISGGAVTLGNVAAYASAGGSPAAGILNNGTNAQSVGSNFTLGNAATLNAASGSLALTGSVATGSNNLVLTGSSSLSVAGGITGNGAVSKTGTGTATLSGTNSYTGATTVSNGTLTLATASSITSTSSVTVASGATLDVNGTLTSVVTVNGTLKGNGTVTGNATINSGATLSPGASAGKLTFNSSNLTLGDTANTTMEIAGTTRGVGGYDAVDVSGALAYDGSLGIPMTGTYTAGTQFNLFDFTSQSGGFDSIAVSGSYTGSLVNNGGGIWSNTISGMIFTFTNSTGVLSLSAQAVPEPLTAAGVILLAGRVLGRRVRASL